MKHHGKCIWLQLRLSHKADSVLSRIKLAYQDRRRAISSARRKQSNTQHQGHTWLFFSFGMIINLWQIPQLHAAQSRPTRKKQLSQWRNVPQRFTRFPVLFEFGNYILFRAVCTLLSRWKHAGLGSVCVSTCACAQERKVQDGSAMGWSCTLLLRGFGVKHF